MDVRTVNKSFYCYSKDNPSIGCPPRYNEFVTSNGQWIISYSRLKMEYSLKC